MMYTSFEINFYCTICTVLGVFIGVCCSITWRNLRGE